MADFQKIKAELSHEEQVLSIVLNVPKGNVLDFEMMQEIIAALQTVARRAGIKAVVFRGEGKHFSFGASVPEHQKEYVADMLMAFHRLFKVFIEVSKPAVAVVRGQCLGGGMELAAFCHWIFAAEDAMFGQPETQLAVFPPVASLILPHRIGQAAAEDLILTGRVIPAAEAQQIGLVHSVSTDPEAELETFLQQHILPKSSVALKFAAMAARHEMHEAFLRHIDTVEKLYVDRLMATEDANEGIAAFLEKRKPVWQNK